jgi:Glu-tRNA(Gln) amidotransferase subunit E-like FAD-binding protein
MSIYIPKFKLNITMDYNFYLNSKLYCNYIKSITKGDHLNATELTQSVIFELLSTECTNDNFGLITNINFKYITNININSKINKNSIKNSMFSFADNEMKQLKQDIFEKKFILIEDENINDDIRIIWKEKNIVLEEFENNFENDDYLKKEKLKEVFDSFLVNTYYKYLKKILSNSSEDY